MSSERTVDVVCAGCGFEYQVSARYARMLRCDGRAPYCRGCAGDRRRKTSSPLASPVITDAETRFWIDRFGFEGAVGLAFAIWGTSRAVATEDLALTASVE